jgi:hypothetical protein
MPIISPMSQDLFIVSNSLLEQFARNNLPLFLYLSKRVALSSSQLRSQTKI